MTQRAIADATNMSTKTVNTTLKALCEAPEGSPAFLQRINSGAYRVNPEVIFKVLTQTEWVFVTNTKKLTRNNKRRTKLCKT